MTAIIATIVQLVAANAPSLISGIRSIIDSAHQNKELTDDEHAQLMKAFIQQVQTDPAWQPSSASPAPAPVSPSDPTLAGG